MAFQNLFIFGATGKVWLELIKQIHTHDGIDRWHKNPTIITWIANSTKYLLNPTWIKDFGTNNIWVLTQNINQSLNHWLSYTWYEEILSRIRQSGIDGDITFVDVTANWDKIIDLHKKIIMDSNNNIVTANKKPVAADMRTFEILTSNPHRYKYNTTVMAGGGAVPYFQESHGLSEDILLVEGTFSWTLAYVCSELEKCEKKFSQIVREAQEKWYTEPHPIDDLNGEDVKRKLLILLRSSWIRIEDTSITLDGMIPNERYKWMNTEEFLHAIEQEDESMQISVKNALGKWLVPRYIASYELINDQMRAQVWLKFISKDSQIWQLKWTANKILIHTSQRTPKGSSPHEITSPGAGTIKTAASVRADLLYLLNGTNLWQHS